jgi:transcriptional regulator with XRE-family HTH domain
MSQRQIVAATVRRLREVAGRSGDEVAQALGWSQAKISRIENARISVSVRDLALMLDYFRADDALRAEVLTLAADAQGLPGAWVVRSGGSARRQGEVAGVESRVVSIRQYQPLTVPGLLQAPSFILELATALRNPDPQGLASLRLARQAALARPGAPRYDVVLDARGLLAGVGDGLVLQEQIEHLRRQAALPAVALRILPLGCRREVLAMSPFTVYEFGGPGRLAAVLIETQTADLYLSSAFDVQTYSTLYESLAAEALDPVRSLDYLPLIRKYHEDMVDDLHRRR